MERRTCLRIKSLIIITHDLQVALTDLGVARHMEKTQTITVVGTDRWMAPEIKQNGNMAKQRYGHQADVYAFGLVALFICCRDDPWKQPPSKGHKSKILIFD